MLMDPGMDSGPILSQTRVPISPTDTTGSITESLAEIGADLLVQTLPGWLSDIIDPRPQNESLATVTRLVAKTDGAIDWNLPATDIWRRVRAYNPWPGAFTTLDGETIHIWASWPLPDAAGTQPPGTVVPMTPVLSEAPAAAFAVQTGGGLLGVIEAQRAGRKRLGAAEFLRGMPDLIGRKFDSA